MSNADDLRAWAEDCIKAYEVRMEALASIREKVSHIKQDAAGMLDGFREADKERATGVSDLKKGVSDLLDNFRDKVDEFKKECEDTAKAWHDLVLAMQAKRTGVAPPKPKIRRGAQEMGRVSGHKR